MNNDIKRKSILLSVFVVLIGLAVAGGTYAWLTTTANVTNATYNATSNCFLVDYLDTNQISGTMFPSVNYTKGLTGKVSLKINSSCNITGTGRIYLHANSTTSTKFGTTAVAHCENATTLETLDDYDTTSECSSGNGSWVTNGTVLKYAIFDNSTGTGTPLRVGYFDGSKIGNDMLLYDGFQITSTQNNYYIFLWLDGYLTDNTYTNLTFDGYIRAAGTQSD